MRWKPDFEHTYDNEIFRDEHRRYFGPEGYFNVGYWEDGVTSPAAASEALTDRLLASVPFSGGVIADVGCGLGATTRRLTQLRPHASVVAVNFSFRQLGVCRTNCPSAALLQMDAACLGLASSSLDAIVCVEAALHFCTRRDFMLEAARVLRPGGVITMTDMLFPASGWPGSFTVPEENFLPNPEAYRELLVSAGFEDIRIEDATEKCWGGFCDGQEAWCRDEPSFDEKKRHRWLDLLVCLRRGVSHYLLISARARHSRV